MSRTVKYCNCNRPHSNLTRTLTKTLSIMHTTHDKVVLDDCFENVEALEMQCYQKSMWVRHTVGRVNEKWQQHYCLHPADVFIGANTAINSIIVSVTQENKCYLMYRETTKFAVHSKYSTQLCHIENFNHCVQQNKSTVTLDINHTNTHIQWCRSTAIIRGPKPII